MEYQIIGPTTLDALISLPSSKSISNRALIIHALSGGTTRPANLSDCDDTRVMNLALSNPGTAIDIGAAGTAMRFLTAYLSVTPGTRLLTGSERMKHRPIGPLVDALRNLGAKIDYEEREGFPPLRIIGTRLEGNSVTLAGNISSQYISALLMIGPMLPQGLRLHLIGEIISRPYINLTLQLMKSYGAEAGWITPDTICVHPGGYKDMTFTVESDWSAASYWYEALALLLFKHRGQALPDNIRVSLPGLREDSFQGDSRGARLFTKLGVQTRYTPTGVTLMPGNTCVEYLEEDFVDIPDLAQTFVVTCCLMGIPFRFTGLQSLRIKETDRMAALADELRKLGYVLSCEQDSILAWDGKRCPAQPSPLIRTYEDHRMAMAFAPASILLPGLHLAEPQVVSKSYPHFWADLRRAGFDVREVD